MSNLIAIAASRILTQVPTLLLATCFSLCLLSPAAMAAGGVDVERLRGVDTLVVDIQPGPGMSLQKDHWQGLKVINVGNPLDATIAEVRKVFLDEKGLSAHSALDFVKSGAPFRPNDLLVHFTLSAREDVLDEKPLKIASLSVRFFYILDNGSQAEMNALEGSYPFIMPDDQGEFLKQLQRGVRFLTDYLPTIHHCVTGPNQNKCLTSAVLDPWAISRSTELPQYLPKSQSNHITTFTVE